MEENHIFTLPSLAGQWSSTARLAASEWAQYLAQSAGLNWVGLLEALPLRSDGTMGGHSVAAMPAAVGVYRPLAGFLQETASCGDPEITFSRTRESGSATSGSHTWVPAPPALRPSLPDGASAGDLMWRCFTPETTVAAMVVVVQVPPVLRSAAQTDAPAGPALPLQKWLAQIDLSWQPLVPLLTNVHRLEQEAASRASTELQLLQRQDWLEQALCYAREVIWELDVPSMTLRYSRYVSALEQVNGQDIPISYPEFTASVHPDDRERVDRSLRDYIEGRSPECNFEYRQRHQDGHWIWSRSRGRAVLRDVRGRPVRILGTAVGISQQKNLETALRASEQRLLVSQAQLLERERELGAALVLAQDAARDRTQFLATMSHEIRTPLNSIVGAARLALLEADPQAVVEHLALINDASALLMNLVNSVLDHSRLQAGAVQLELRPVCPSRLLQDVARQFAQAAQSRGIDLRVRLAPELPAAVQADALRLTQVINNLVANAVRFTHVGAVELSAESLPGVPTADGCCRLRFSVSDSGIGMTPVQCERLFQPYGQADETIARRYGGTGLGLSISHRLVELMGGALTVRSQLGVGSVFSFECDWLLSDAAVAEVSVLDPLPSGHLARADRAGDLLAKAALQLRGLRVLVVDDNPMNILVVRKLLEKAQVVVRTTDSPLHALQVLEVERFDAVLMDLYMPEMSGADATKRLRQNPRHRALPVLAVSASVTPEERELCRASGMNAFISKPLDPQNLMETLILLCAPPPRGRHTAEQQPAA